MEYSDGHDPVEPGEELTLDHQDLGPAQYDADHDGVADSVIIGQDNHTVMLTDTDGDGEVDTRSVVNEDGSVERAGSSGSEDDTTSSPDDTSTDGTSGDSTGSDSTGSDGTEGSTGTTETGSAGDADSAGGPISVVDDQGRTIEVGPPTVDMNGDGTPDTAVVRNDDGSTIGYTDRNGDGEADQITEISTDRHVTISVQDGDGAWHVVQSGTLDDKGTFVPDPGEGPTEQVSAPAPTDGVTGESAVLGLAAAGTGESAAEVDAAPATTDEAAPLDAPGPITYTDPDGNTYQLGVPTEDFDGDGRPDTVVTTLDDGTVVGYSDVDGDGLTDQVTQINTDGTVTIGVPDGAGGWEQAATGTLGASGEFVPSEATTSV